MSEQPRRTWAVFTLRRDIPRWQALLLSLLCIACCFGIWHLLTLGEPEERVLSPGVLPSLPETFASFHSLWFDRALTRNLFASLRRVCLGFGLAALVGVPLGVLCGCYPWLNAFFAPLTIFGRNIPVAALIPLTYSLFGIGEYQKVMFIFIACVAFVLFDTAGSVAAVDDRYIDTAYTLGASRRQIILKVLVPLALPSIFNSMRLLFGLAFGYIMLAELIKFGGSSGGLGDLINVSQHRGQQTHILLILLIIPIVALAIDRLLYWIECQLFPYQYGGAGVLHNLTRGVLHRWEDFRGLLFKPTVYARSLQDASAVPTSKKP
jgi:ABC-type nitrate/sulfonate/bicarbonate transport system permease component